MSNPMKDYVDNFRANLPSGVTYDSGVSRYFVNGKRFVSEWEAERYLDYIVKFGAAPALTVATTGGPGQIIFDPIAPLDEWTATTGNAGEIILEAA